MYFSLFRDDNNTSCPVHFLLWSQESLKMTEAKVQEAWHSPLHLKSCQSRYLAPPSGDGLSCGKACQWDFCTGSAGNERPSSEVLTGPLSPVSSGHGGFLHGCEEAPPGWESPGSGSQEPQLAEAWWGWGVEELGVPYCPLWAWWDSPKSQACD